jgi:hypothetical protein
VPKVREGDEFASDRINDAGFALSLERGARHGPKYVAGAGLWGKRALRARP